MQNADHNAKVSDSSGAGIGSGMLEDMHPSGHYIAQFHNAEGELVWEDEILNLVTTVGKNFFLDTLLAGSAYTASWFMGLVDGGSTPTYNAADTMASHAGWTENTAYSNSTRPAPSWSSAAAGSKATSAAVVFNINSAGTIAGAFLNTVSTKAGTTGTLYSEGNFSGGNQPVSNGGTLSISYSSSLT